MKIVFYDLETSGTNNTIHEIIQIAAQAYDITFPVKDIRISNWRLLDQIEMKLLFDVNKADPQALNVNCYDEDTWNKESISQKDGYKKFNKFIKRFADVKRISKRTGKPFYCVRTGGHNIIKFDDPFIRQAWYAKFKEFCPIDYQQIYDTLQLSLWTYSGLKYKQHTQPENFKLCTLCESLNIELDNAHDALSDITANVQLAKALLQ